MKRSYLKNKFRAGAHFIILLGITVVFSGCAKVRHLPRLLTIKKYSENKDAQARFVKLQNESFESISRAVEEKKMDSYKNRDEIQKAFGDPVFSRLQMIDNEELDVWLYRPGVDYSPREKVYLYFDTNGDLIRWERVLSENKLPKGMSSTKFRGGPS